MSTALERYEPRGMLITANQPFSGWDHVLPDPDMTGAAIDRPHGYLVVIASHDRDSGGFS